MRRSILALMMTATATAACQSQEARPVDAPVEAVLDPNGAPLGSVAVPTFSCSEGAATGVRRGLALLHNMTYAEARATFENAARLDGDCVLAYWGAAMTYLHPLWPDTPSPGDLAEARRLLAEARSEGSPGSHEEAYLAPLEAYLEAAEDRSETQRLDAFAAGWEASHSRFPGDPEIELFRALSLLASAEPSERMAVHDRAGTVAQAIAGEIPDHPGALHYVIHAYDLPEYAHRAADAADAYGEVAPENSHALHMTSHIFTRLGSWERSIDFNERAARAALQNPVDGKLSFHYLHAADYLVYARLQRGDDEGARAVLENLKALDGPVSDHAAAAYALAAIPARIQVERQAWEEAARLDSRWTTLVPWDRYPQLEAIPVFARGLGAARSGRLADAEAALERLRELERAATTLGMAYDWAEQVRIQAWGLEAWIAYAEGRTGDALERMREAQELEASTVKNPVTPGELLPAAELLGDMLMEMERFQEAREAYDIALRRAPNRLNSLFGAGRAAEALGNEEDARRHYSRLVANLVDTADFERAGHARAFLREH